MTSSHFIEAVIATQGLSGSDFSGSKYNAQYTYDIYIGDSASYASNTKCTTGLGNSPEVIETWCHATGRYVSVVAVAP